MNKRALRKSTRLEEKRPVNETAQCSENESPVPKRGRGRPKGSTNNKKKQEIILTLNIDKEDSFDANDISKILSSLTGDRMDKNVTINLSKNGSKTNDSSPLRDKSKRASENFSPTVTSSQRKNSSTSSRYKEIYSDSEDDYRSVNLSDQEVNLGNDEEARSDNSSEEVGDKSNPRKSGQNKKIVSKPTKKVPTEKFSIRSWLLKTNKATGTPVAINDDLNETGGKNKESVLSEDESGDELTHAQTTNKISQSPRNNTPKDSPSNVNSSSVIRNNEKRKSNSISTTFRKFTKSRFTLRKSKCDKNVNNTKASSDESNSEHERENDNEEESKGENDYEEESKGDSSASDNELSVQSNYKISEKTINLRSSVRKQMVITVENNNEDESKINSRSTRSWASKGRYSLRSSNKQPIVLLEKLKPQEIEKRNLRSNKNKNCKNASSSEESSHSGDESWDEESLNGDELSTKNKKDSEERASNLNQVDNVTANKTNNHDIVDESTPCNNLNASTQVNFDKELLSSQNIDSPSKLDGLSQESRSNLTVIPVEKADNIRLVNSVVERILITPDKNKAANEANLSGGKENYSLQNVNGSPNDCSLRLNGEKNSVGSNSDKSNENNFEVMGNEENSAISCNVSSNNKSKVGGSKENESSSDKCLTVTSSSDPASQKNDNSAKGDNLASNKKPNQVIPEILMSEFNKKLAMISEVTSTQNDDNKNSSSDTLCIDESSENAAVVNNSVNNSNLQGRVDNEDESSVRKDTNERKKSKNKNSSKSSLVLKGTESDFEGNVGKSKLFQEADDLLKEYVEKKANFNRSERELPKISNIVRQEKSVGKSDSEEDAESSDSGDSDSSSAAEIEFNKPRGENSESKKCLDKSGKIEGSQKINAENGPVKHKISIVDGSVKHKPGVEEKEMDSSSDSDSESVSLKAKNSSKTSEEKEEECIKKYKAELMKKFEPLGQSESDSSSSSESDSDEEERKNLEKVESARGSLKSKIPRKVETSKKQKEETEESSDTDSSDSVVDQIKTLQKYSAEKLTISSESDTDLSSVSNAEGSKTNRMENLLKKLENNRRSESADSSSSESESDNDSGIDETCVRNISNVEKAKNDATAAKSKTSSDSDSSSESSDDESPEMKEPEIQINNSKIAEAMMNISPNKELLPGILENQVATRRQSNQRSPARSIYTSSEDDNSDLVKKNGEGEKTPVIVKEIIQIPESPCQMYFIVSTKRRLSKSLESVYSLEKGEVVSKTLGTEVKEDEGTPVKEIPLNNDLQFNCADSDVESVREIPKAAGKVMDPPKTRKVKESRKKNLCNDVTSQAEAQKAVNVELVKNPFFESFNKKSSNRKGKSRTKKLPEEKKAKKGGARTNKLPSSKKIKIKLDDDYPIIDLEELQLKILKKEMLTRAAAAAAAKGMKDLDKGQEVGSAKKTPKRLTKKEEIKRLDDAKEVEQVGKEEVVQKLHQEEAEEMAKEDVKDLVVTEVEESPVKTVKKAPKQSTKKKEIKRLDDAKEVEQLGKEEVVQKLHQEEAEEMKKTDVEDLVVTEVDESPVKTVEKVDVKEVEELVVKEAEKSPVEKVTKKVEENVEKPADEEPVKLVEEEVVDSAEKEVIEPEVEKVIKPIEEEMEESSSEEKDKHISEEKFEEDVIKSAEEEETNSAKTDVKKLSKKKAKKSNKKHGEVIQEEAEKLVKKDEGKAKKRSKNEDEVRPAEVQTSKKKKLKKSTSTINQTENDIQPLPRHIVSKLESTKPPVIKKLEKPVQKLKRKAMEHISDDELPISKKINTGDYIPLEVSGPTKFGVTPLNKFKKALPYSHHAAANFKTQMLYGDRIKRLPSEKLKTIKEKRKFCK